MPDPTGDAPSVVRERTRRSRFLALPGAALLPEMPRLGAVASQLAALADPTPLRRWVRGHREADDLVPPLEHSPQVAGKFLFDESSNVPAIWARHAESSVPTLAQMRPASRRLRLLSSVSVCAPVSRSNPSNSVRADSAIAESPTSTSRRGRHVPRSRPDRFR